MTRAPLAVALTLTLAGSGATSPLAAQMLETETARPLGRGVFEVSGNFEYQTSSEGREAAVPFAAEYGVTDRLEILVEPVAWTAIRPNAGTRATGVGDLEATLTWLARAETPQVPAIALASEVKFPTAHNTLIGTGKTDVAGYLIGSKRWGRLDTHANVSYTVVGRPAGADLKNIFGFALGAEWNWNRSNQLFGEILANTAAAAAAEPAPGTVVTAPEAPGGEVSATFGVAHRFLPSLRGFIGVSADNNGAVLFRPGITMRVH
ncbi:MAG: hypothetical protein ABI766_10710 [Gemmatimonadales bacterium]